MMLINDVNENKAEVYTAWLGEEAEEAAMKLTNDLRKAGVNAAVDFGARGMKGHMKKADKLGVNYVIIIGEDEMAKGTAVLKDFNARTQEELTIPEILKKLAK